MATFRGWRGWRRPQGTCEGWRRAQPGPARRSSWREVARVEAGLAPHWRDVARVDAGLAPHAQARAGQARHLRGAPCTPLRPAPLVLAAQASATDDGRRQRHARVVRLDSGARRRGRPYRRPCFGLARPGVRQAARQCRGFAAAFHGGTSMACGYSGVGTPMRPAPPVLAAQASATGGALSETCRVVRLVPGARRRGRPYRRPCFGLARPGVRQAARQCRRFAAAFLGGTSMAGGYSGPALRGRAFASARASGAQARSLTPSGGGCGAASAGVRGRPGCRSGWWTGSCGPAASAGRAGRHRG